MAPSRSRKGTWCSSRPASCTVSATIANRPVWPWPSTAASGSTPRPDTWSRRKESDVAIDPEVRELAQGKNFAAFTSLLPGGAPMTHMMWVDCDEDHILINTEVHRGKYKNVLADTRVAVMIMDANDDGRYADVTGRVVERVTGPQAR